MSEINKEELSKLKRLYEYLKANKLGLAGYAAAVAALVLGYIYGYEHLLEATKSLADALGKILGG